MGFSGPEESLMGTPQRRREGTWRATSAQPNRPGSEQQQQQETGFVTMKINKLAIFSRAAAGSASLFGF